MKICYVFFIVSLITGFAGKTYAQSTAYAPYDGATHTYTVGGLTNGDTFEFYLSKDPNGINKTSTVSDAGIISTTTNSVGPDGKATVTIQWASDASSKYGSGLYLFIAVTSSSCPNYRDVKIMPVANIFAVTLIDVTGQSNPGIATGPFSNPSCPDIILGQKFQPVVNSGSTPSDGQTMLTFRVDRKNSTNAWKFNFSINCSLTSTTYTYSITGKATSSLGSVATTPTGPVDVTCAVGDDYAFITILVDNKQGDSPSFKVTINSAQDTQTGTSDLTAGVAKSITHTIDKLPVIGSFTGN